MSQDSNEDIGSHQSQKIVVGVDGSTDSQVALDWALAFAGPEDKIEVVHTWTRPRLPYGAGYTLDPAPFADSAQALLDVEMDRLRAGDANLANVTTRCVHGHPGIAMLHASEGADLLVVGTRGRGGFTGLLLGSTSTYLAHHAQCPLVIVPNKNEATEQPS